MLIAEKLSKTNSAEYLLYMWQVEDIIRAHHCDLEELKKHYLARFDVDEDNFKKIEDWYANLVEMMHLEGKMNEGHLQINKNFLQDLNELHLQLCKSSKYPFYRTNYYKVLPYIVEIRAKNKNYDQSELEVCFELLYGVMMLRLQKKELSKETTVAATDVSRLLAQLSELFLKNKEVPLDF